MNPWNRPTLEERYSEDPAFHSLVDQFLRHYEDMKQLGTLFTPTEVREAAIFAMTLWEYKHIRPITIRLI